MAVTGLLSHIDVSVGRPERSIPFYHAFFTALGFRRWKVSSPEWSEPNPQRATWGIHYANGARFDVEVRPSRPESRDAKYDRYAPGPHHIAFHADSDAAVDRVYQAMLAVGAEILDAPKNYGGEAGYGDYYYALFVADPDNIKLEVCYVPAANR